MKYVSSTSFFKHLRASFPDHLFPIYLIFSEDAFERKKILQRSARILSENPRVFQEISIDELLHECNSPSFFEERTVIAVDFPNGIEKMEAMQLLKKIPQMQNVILLFSSSSKKGWQKVISFAEKEGVIVEPAGKKEDRMAQYVQAKAKQMGKILTPQITNMIVEKANKDFSLLVQECEKLFAYVGDKKQISIEDLHIITSRDFALWEYVDKFLWAREFSSFSTIDESLFFPLVASFRKELRLGIRLCASIKDPKILSSISLWPSLLSKRKKQALAYTERYFREGLIALFDVELLAKDGVSDYNALITYFLVRINKHVIPAT